MVTRDTKDEAYLWSSRKKEMQMRRELESLKRKLRMKRGLPPEERPAAAPLTKGQLEDLMTVTQREELSLKVSEQKGQKSLGQFEKKAGSDGQGIVVSPRASAMGVKDELEAAGFVAEERELESADVVISPRVAASVHTLDQFIQGISNGSVFATLAKLKHEYLHPILIVQGAPQGEGSQAGNAAVYDALSAVLAEYHVSVLSTSSASETATMIASLSRQEEAKQSGRKKPVQTTLDPASRQMFMVQGLPNVSATLAQRLLKRFGSIKGIADADVEELMRVEGIGRVIGEGIHTVLRQRFGEEEE